MIKGRIDACEIQIQLRRFNHFQIQESRQLNCFMMIVQIIRILLTFARVPFFRHFADVKDCKLIDPLPLVNFCKKC